MKKYLKLFLEAVRVIRLYKNWFEIISNHFKAGKDTTDLILRNGIRYKIHPRNTDMGLIQEIHSENIYQIRRGDISRNGVVIDIGAHIGIMEVQFWTLRLQLLLIVNSGEGNGQLRQAS